MQIGRHQRRWISTMGLAVALGLVGCSRDSKLPTTPQPPPSFGLEECGGHNVFVGRNFPNPTVIDSKWFPLVPGRQLIFDGESNLGAGLLPHRVVLTVTSLTKTLSGVRTVVVWDRDYNNGVLEEAELAFFAQDKDGSVWTLGEYPEEYQNGEFVGAPSTWIVGAAGAEAGILVPGQPVVGNKFLQGFAPDINFLDCASVFEMGGSTCVPFNCYENVLVVDESSPLDVGSGHQRKYYAAGVGNVRIGPVNDPEGETLVLVNNLQLGAQALAESNEAALRLEARAYQISDVYRDTPRARYPEAAAK
jgi:hypothetical protein